MSHRLGSQMRLGFSDASGSPNFRSCSSVGSKGEQLLLIVSLFSAVHHARAGKTGNLRVTHFSPALESLPLFFSISVSFPRAHLWEGTAGVKVFRFCWIYKRPTGLGFKWLTTCAAISIGWIVLRAVFFGWIAIYRNEIKDSKLVEEMDR